MKKSINHNFSLYLDFLRTLAAFVVFCTHTQNFLLPGVHLGLLGLGREAVAIFFVLSGFVISYVVNAKETHWQEYAIARLARIYPVAILAIFVTFLLDKVGAYYDPAYYPSISAAHGNFLVPVSLSAFFSYITFTNQIWWNHAIFGSSEPYWSLGFEVQYYIFFLFFCFAQGRKKIVLVMLWAVFCGPKILLYLPLWLLGAFTRKLIFDRTPPGNSVAVLIYLFSLILFAIDKHFGAGISTNMYKSYPVKQEIINFLYFTIIGLAVASNLFAASIILDRFKPIGIRSTKAMRWLAGGSFTLYLIHQPILVFFGSFIKSPEIHRATSLLAVLATLFLAYLLAEVAERRKKFYVRFFDWIRPRVER